MSADRRKIRLPSGLEVEIDGKTHWGASTLNRAAVDLVQGVTTTFVLIECNERGQTRTTIHIGSDKNLDVVSDKLVEQSKQLRHIGSQWQGTAPAENRSTSEH